ncbi:MAG: response regulator [Anaerolineae bacterium]
MTDAVGRILVVDDNGVNRLKLQRVLQVEGHSVEMAQDGTQALSALERTAVDLVLLDIMMPGMDGYDVLRTMKASPELRDIPVIVVSAIDEQESAVRCIEIGADDYLIKPVNPVFLKARLDSCIRRKRLRDLEQAYLKQEIMLRQSEKLATLGRLSAGLTHELNNPAAAIRRGAQHLSEALARDRDALKSLAEHPEALRDLLDIPPSDPVSRPPLSPLDISDLESDAADWLEARSIPAVWDLAPDLVARGLTADDLQKAERDYGGGAFEPALRWLAADWVMGRVLAEVTEAAKRVSDLVMALKQYTYLDRSPVLNVNVHDGLENTLIMLNSRLGRGIQVHRDYAEDLPPIEAYSSELNQVWTNLIDNAAAAMNGQGELTLRTRQANGGVTVEVIDSGPGIPEAIQPNIFDPFFTTKPPGEGTGLGLNISHSIIVEKHHGEISVESIPGRTRFRVWLPLTLERSGSGAD